MNKQFNINNFILGIFFLLFPTYAYSIGGNMLKYLSLIIGFILLFKSNPFFERLKSDPFIAFFSVSYFLILVLISFLLEQETTEILILTFDFICMCLFLFGYYMSKKQINISHVSNYTKIIIVFLIFVGAFYLMKIQLLTQSAGFHSRDLQDSFLNVNGIAFITAQLVILILWLIYIEKEKFYIILLNMALVVTLGCLLFTESRGAILFLIITLIFSFGFNFIKTISFKSSFTLILFLASTYIYFTYNSQFLPKIQLSIDRLFSLFELVNTNNQDDLSINARSEILENFLNTYDQMTFGEKYYSPYPHNQFLEIFMRWGIIGLPIFIISIKSFLKSFKYIYKRHSKNNLTFIISSFLFFTYLQSMTSLSLDNNRLLWLGFGYLIGNSEKSFRSSALMKNQ